ncbi:MAG: CHAT domain-containing tetratricopeptide repeat protein [Pyrinomonadaceae bacterium]
MKPNSTKSLNDRGLTVFRVLMIGVLVLAFYSLVSAEVPENGSSKPSAADLESLAEQKGREWNKKAFEDYMDLYGRAAALWSEAGRPDKVADCYRKIAHYRELLGDYQTASLKLKEALRIEETGRSPEGQIKTLSFLSNVSLKAGRDAESEGYFQRALQLSRSSKDPVSLATVFHSAAEYYYARRDFESAGKYYRDSLDNWEKTDGQNIEQAQTLVDYGYFMMSVNGPMKGLDILSQAEAKFQELGNPRGLALTRIAAGHLNSNIDRKQSALKYYQLADRNFPEDMDFIELARLSNGIGLIYEDFGEWDLSLQYRRKAFDLFKKDDYPRGQLATLPSLVKLSYLTGDEKGAVDYYSETERLSKKLNDQFYLAVTKQQVGDFYFERKEDEKAVRYYRETLEVLKKFNSKNDFALIQNNLGTIYIRQNKLGEARRFYEVSLEITREVEDKFNEAATLYNLAELDLLEGRFENALEEARQSIAITEDLASETLNSKLTGTYFSGVYDRYELYINLLMKMHRRFPEKDYALRALQASERSRSRSMLEELRLAEADFFRDADPQIVRREQEIRNSLNLKSNKLTELLIAEAPRSETDKLSAEINELTDRLEATKAELKQKSPIYSAIKNPPDFDVREFQEKVLEDGTLFLEFAFGREESFLWVIGKKEFDVYGLPGRENLEGRIEKLRQLLISREKLPEEDISGYQARLKANDEEYDRQAQILSDQLFGQIRDKLPEKRLVFVTDGKLQLLPIAALPFPQAEGETGEKEPLLLTNEIVYEPSASTLSLLRSGPKAEASASRKDLLVFADPIFSPEDARLAGVRAAETGKDQVADLRDNLRSMASLRSLRRLTASEKESNSIIESVGRQNATLFEGFSANRKAFLSNNLTDYKVLHFAAHGFLNEERPELSGIVLSQLDPQGNKIDGFIRLQDIYGLNLSADLVVLSACDTGIGKEVRGEGVLSLDNGFLQSGARSVISSRWKVDDQATFELMRGFYEEMTGRGATASEALRRAQIRMRENPRYRSPFYWAAFTLQGDYQSKPDFAGEVNYLKYVLLLFSVLGLFVVYRWIRNSRMKGNHLTEK